jgi:hypothetical protein
MPGDFPELEAELRFLSSSACQDEFNIAHLTAVIVEAVKRDRSAFVSGLLCRSLPMSAYYALEAVQ